MYPLNATHDPARQSWVASAGRTGGDFPIQNLPFGVFSSGGPQRGGRVGVAIGDAILDLQRLHALQLLKGAAAEALQACSVAPLNPYMALGPRHWSALRAALSALLAADSEHRAVLQPLLVPQTEVEMLLPAQIGDFTDFYTSIHHATHVGRLFRPDQPLLPNYKWVPIAYHGRSSSIGVSPQTFHRPRGQQLPPKAEQPVVGPSMRLDYELEVGCFIGCGNGLGEPIALDAAEQHLFGLCLLNDWSARDLQAWEYQPLGPFLAKNFATTIAPWIVSMEALEPFRTGWSREPTDPQPLPYLDSASHRSHGAVDLQLEVWLQTAQMRQAGRPAERIAKSGFREAYWTLAQMVAHHTVNGCNLRPGDLLGSGTQSGSQPGQCGSLLEQSAGGRTPLRLTNGETRSFLADGDEVTLRGYCEAPGRVRIGFGEARGTVLPARG
ncbi:MAG TPA: fumarylacetoacetase [Steroidobacteraceae bacterium]|nr:fumarylacetoacetase [Steroidobacteraceae bacterium]